MSFADPFGARFEVFGREHKHTVEGINRPAFEKLRSLLNVGAGGDGRVVLLRAPRAGYGKTSILQRLAGQFEESHHFVRVSLVSGRKTDAVHVLEYVLQALCQVLPESTTLTRLDLLARKLLALGLEPLVASGEVPCQDREGALVALREQPAETFDFHHDRAVTAHWTKSNFEILGPRMAAELASKSGASLREASYWVELLFRFATTAPDNVERARLLFETVFRGELQGQSESAAEERLHGLLALCGTVTNLVLIVDDTEGLSTAPDDALALSSFLTNISQSCPGTLVLLSLNDDIWESAFLPLLPGGLADRLMENEVALRDLTREEAEALITTRAGKRAEEVIERVDWDSSGGKLYSRQVLKWASDIWQTLEHRDESGFDVIGTPERETESMSVDREEQEPVLEDPFADQSELGEDEGRGDMHGGPVPGVGPEREINTKVGLGAETAGRVFSSDGVATRPTQEPSVPTAADEEPTTGPWGGPGERNPFADVGVSTERLDEKSGPGTPSSIFGEPTSPASAAGESLGTAGINPFSDAASPRSASGEPGRWDQTDRPQSASGTGWSSGPPVNRQGNQEALTGTSAEAGNELREPGQTGEMAAPTETPLPEEGASSERETQAEVQPSKEVIPSGPMSAAPVLSGEVTGEGQQTSDGTESFSPFSVVSGSARNERYPDEITPGSEAGATPFPRPARSAREAFTEGSRGQPVHPPMEASPPVQNRNPFEPAGPASGERDPEVTPTFHPGPGTESLASPPAEVPSTYSPFKPVALEPADPSTSPFAKADEPSTRTENELHRQSGAPVAGRLDEQGGQPGRDQSGSGPGPGPEAGLGPENSPFVAVGKSPEAENEVRDSTEEQNECASAPAGHTPSPEGPGRIDELLRQFKERYGRKD